MKIAEYHRRYRSGESPADVINEIRSQIEETRDYNIWINVADDAVMGPYLDRLNQISIDDHVLWGIPFAVKDNIDLAGMPTTAGCPAFEYMPKKSAFLVQKLINAGAIPIGKTNLDQFATGLVGTRSPYGETRNALNPNFISGGSSSGSAVAVALEQASFALGTDTAGSGRVPAAMNGLVGIKPTRGKWSLSGVIPACQTLDCVSLFTKDVDDARIIADVLSEFDGSDPWSQPITPRGFDVRNARYAVASKEALVAESCDEDIVNQYLNIAKSLNATTIDITPFLEAARLLYEGPWIAERYAAIEDFIRDQPQELHPVTREIISGGKRLSAVDSFKAQYRLKTLKRIVEVLYQTFDVLVLPTIPTAYTIEQVLDNPIVTNSHLGTFTNFVNLLDLSALAMPSGKPPSGITFIAPAGCDDALLELAGHYETGEWVASQPRKGEFHLAVCGAHLAGQPLNGDLVKRGAYLVARTTTTPNYRLYLLEDNKRPALVRGKNGQMIEIEIWALPVHAVGSFLQTVTPPLGIGSVETVDGHWVNGFIAEARATEEAEDITRFGGWLEYRAQSTGLEDR